MMNSQSRTRRCAWGLVVVLTLLMVPGAQAAFLPGTVPTDPGLTVFPGLTDAPPGTLLASMVSPWSFVVPPPTGGATSGELRSAVFMNPTGTLDFYYQVVNNMRSSTAIARESNANFAGFETWTGFRLDGASLPGGIFTNGTVTPFTADRDITGIVVGFNFGPLPANRVLAGTTSAVLVVSTDATLFTVGNASIIDGGTATVAAFQPTPIPEPSSALLVCGGLAAAVLRLRRRRQ